MQVTIKSSQFFHGADYNPEQWLKSPAILDDDIQLMKQAKCNVMSVGIFSWAALEPEEGHFNFTWLRETLDKLYANGINVFLATPSGARPHWLAQKYPEVLRVDENRVKQLFGKRHNHCYSSPVYREKVSLINRKLAEEFKEHPALKLWHVSNEYGGECHCPLCQENFRLWLKKKYNNDMDALNGAYWTAFWSHTYSDWEQVESPSPIGDNKHGLVLDWKRFVTYITADFMDNECVPLRELTPNIPVSTNLMGARKKVVYPGIDYAVLSKHMDIISWDSYPDWKGTSEDIDTAINAAFSYDLMYGLKNQPFLLMESTPSLLNRWTCTLKRPGMHLLSSLQAVAHGSDSVQYFQWRKSRGGAEKFHGAVIGHDGRSDTRVFNDVTQAGEGLSQLSAIRGTASAAQTGLIFDWENLWAQDAARALQTEKKTYDDTCIAHYKALWNQNIPVHIFNEECDFSPYKVLIAPMLYLLKPGVAKHLTEYVKNGGILVTTFWSGLVDENDLCFYGKSPLSDVLGIRTEEIDTLDEKISVRIEVNNQNYPPLKSEYAASLFCELVHLEGARPLALYASEFYQGMPCLTVNEYGKGKAYTILCNLGQDFLNDFYRFIANEAGLEKPFSAPLPTGVYVRQRTSGETNFIFLMNFNSHEVGIKLPCFAYDLLKAETTPATFHLAGYGVKVLTNGIKE